MKKRGIKIIVLIAVILSLFMSGCADGRTTGGTIKEPKIQGDKDARGIPSWQFEHTSMEQYCDKATIKGDKIYGCAYTDWGIAVLVQDIKTGACISNYEIPNVAEIQDITVDAQNTICLFGSTESSNALWQVAEDGTVHQTDNIELEGMGLYPLVKGFWADTEGHYYLWYEMSVPCAEVYPGGEQDVYTKLDRIYVKDQKMNTICSEQVPNSYANELLCFLFDEKEMPVILAKDEDGYYTRRVRTENREEYKQNRLDALNMYDMENGNNFALAENGLLYTREGVLHRYQIEKGMDEELMELSSGGIYEEDILYLGMRGDQVEIIDNYRDSGKTEYTCAMVGESERITVSLGVMLLRPELRDVISDFNRYQTDIQIEPVIYADEYDFDTGYEKLKLDILQGKAPDIISTEGIDYEILANQGAFIDLYSLMEKDVDCPKNQFVDTVLEAYEKDGCLYTIAPRFFIHSLWGGKSTVQGRNGVNMKELMQILTENGADVNSIYGFGGDEDVLRELCTLELDEYIDWGQNTCDFTGEGFGELLEFVKKYRGLQSDSLYTAIQNKDVLLKQGIITSVYDYCLEKELFGEQVQFIGYPSAKGKSGILASMNGTLALNAKCGCTDEAWKFMKYYLLHGYGYMKTGFPIQKSQFEEVINASVKEQTFLAEDGNEGRIAQKTYKEKDIVDIQIYKAEQDDVAVVRELVWNISGKFEYNQEIQNMIDEEADAYFHGQKSLQEVAEIIQNRVQLFLDEQK